MKLKKWCDKNKNLCCLIGFCLIWIVAHCLSGTIIEGVVGGKEAGKKSAAAGKKSEAAGKKSEAAGKKSDKEKKKGDCAHCNAQKA